MGMDCARAWGGASARVVKGTRIGGSRPLRILLTGAAGAPLMLWLLLRQGRLAFEGGRYGAASAD